MAITSTGLNSDIYTDYQAPEVVEDKSALGKDDFMTLLLVELQNQDPTEPMDSDKILTQTSQLAGLEATDNTNTALANLATALGSTQQFSTVAAIGKTADLGSNAISFDEGSVSSFEVYFPQEIASGNVEILDVDGNLVSTVAIEPNTAGVYEFDWDGVTDNGGAADSGVYYVTASYKNSADEELSTRMGAYPIESVRFEGAETLVKVGSSYVPLSNVVEIY